MTPTSRHLLRSAAWNHAGRLAEYALLYAESILIARGLGLSGNGEWAWAMTVANALPVLCSMGLEAALVLYVPRAEASGASGGARRLIRSLLLLRALLAAAVTSVAAIVLLVHVPWPEASPLLLVLPLALVRTLIPFLSALLTLRFRTAESSAAGVAARLLEIGALLALLDEGLTLASVALALTGGAVVHLALLFWSTRSEFHGPRAPAALRPALVFGGVFWLNSVADYFLGRQGDVLLLGALLHPGKGPASLYDVAYTMVQTVSLAATVGFSGVALSGFSRAASGAGDPPRLYATVLRVATGLSVPLLSYVLWNAGTLVAVLYGPAFSAAAPLLMAMASFRIVARAFGGGENTDLLLAHGQVAPVVRAGLVAAGVNVALDFALIPSWGAAGAVVASGCAGIFVLAVTAHLLRRGALGAPAFAFWLRVTVPALLIGRLSALVPPGSTVYSHSAHALAYAAVTFAFFMFIPILPYTDRISIRAAAVRLLARVRS